MQHYEKTYIHYSNEIENSKQRITEMNRETIEIGTKTCEELHRQSEQLDRISKCVDSIDHNIEKSDKIVTRMKHWFVGIFVRTKKINNNNIKKEKREEKEEKEKKHDTDEQVLDQLSNTNMHANTNMHIGDNDQFLTQVSDDVKIMKKLANVMSHELDYSTEKIDTLNGRLPNTEKRLTKVTHKTRSMM